ncbi:manganese efflux pump MntP family protein [Aliiglaciecola sp. 3_MG-2023]|uniref:manganese efflux pump MntP n=1 Tax=Aliiglaciecola sp. 3_MG-2023 TaxID=3062644 RepID=UPI0026E441F9|nr:manganese efflux pump MntP family protein [Aliiglaciecola sp. 3_MG-2023]MDO6695666.1 manganese efflux pump MntP family protein [Aliiglaciecola sp. 3_MG-2023]
MIEVFILAIALSMDAFAVSIGLGAKCRSDANNLAYKTAFYFGLFQGIMPLFGYFSGKGLSSWVNDYAPWIAFMLLILIGGKMIYESFVENIEDDISRITHRILLTLAIATSIDAMAAGYAITLMDVSVFSACLVIGLTTFGFSWLGVKIGGKSGTMLESKAELLGGIVLILIGFKLLL